MTAGKTETEVVGYVLAGGGSTRFGRDKALVEVGGTPMLKRMIELLRQVTKEVKIVAAANKYAAFGVTTVEDRWPGEEPLCACWQTAAAAKLRSEFESGVRKVTAGIALLRAEVLDEADWKRFDSAGRLFWNMNTAADYDEARGILEAERE